MAKKKVIYFEKTLINHNGKEDSPMKSPLKFKRAENYEDGD